MVIKFTGELTSISNVLINKNGTEYRVGTVKFINPNTNLPVERRCTIWEKNYNKGMELNKPYLCTFQRIGDTNTGYINVSAIPIINNPTLDDFDITDIHEEVKYKKINTAFQ